MKSNQIAKLKRILTKHNVDVIDQKGSSLLMWACYKGNTEMCQVLLNKGAFINMKNDEGWTALKCAAFTGRIEVCTLLVENSANVNLPDNSGASPLFSAAQNGHLGVCTLLLKNNAHVNQRTKNHTSALFVAVEMGHVHICALLLGRNGDVNQRRKDGAYPFYIAVQNGNIDLCTLLLSNKANVNQQIAVGTTPLMVASSFGHIKVCEFLLQNGADINLKDGDGDNALFYAVRQKRYDICRLLIQYDIDMNIRGHYGRSLLETAKATNDEVIISLIKKQQNSKLKDNAIEQASNLSKKLDMKQIIKIKSESLGESNNAKTRLEELKQLWLKKQEERGNLETQVKFLIQETNIITSRLNEITKVECPICFNEMISPIKIFQCSEGHVLCEKCFKSISESNKVCPFCRIDIVTKPIRNRHLEEIIENIARNNIGATSRN